MRLKIDPPRFLPGESREQELRKTERFLNDLTEQLRLCLSGTNQTGGGVTPAQLQAALNSLIVPAERVAAPDGQRLSGLLLMDSSGHILRAEVLPRAEFEALSESGQLERDVMYFPADEV